MEAAPTTSAEQLAARATKVSHKLSVLGDSQEIPLNYI